MWAPHPVEGYQLGQIVDVGADSLSVQPLASSEQVSELAVLCVVRWWPGTNTVIFAPVLLAVVFLILILLQRCPGYSSS